MKFYEKEVNRIKKSCFSNRRQVETVRRLRRYIELNYGEELCLESMSRASYVSKFHLLRLFKKLYGRTPNQYLTEIRMEKAKEFLAKGMSATDACFAVGFDSLGSFGVLFKRKTGFSPAQYRKSNFRED
ncbi:hypothetical protein FUAX_01630 [Fulvitalea axinellae]|uniref:HTH araC/xylS-type domain-containing protein n=1 Tax=Fulvitalea axinellae TaxID=1182444 RepID=A0AAU9C6S0_9BACT|nr:hypothetical protein FUAX_01630 [Fulvitalea axinellae]